MNIETENIIDKINETLVNEFEVDRDLIAADMNLRDTLDLDSLDYVDLVVIIESKFGVKLVESDFVGIVTFQDFYNLILQKIAAKQGK
jgi:acyl carrier protein